MYLESTLPKGVIHGSRSPLYLLYNIQRGMHDELIHVFVIIAKLRLELGRAYPCDTIASATVGTKF